jgi:hypothetical protein
MEVVINKAIFESVYTLLLFIIFIIREVLTMELSSILSRLMTVIWKPTFVALPAHKRSVG